MKKTLLLLIILTTFLPLVFAANPTIDTVTTDAASYNPTEGSTTNVIIRFNVSDADGVADLNDSACRCDVDDQATYAESYASNTSCGVSDLNTTTTEYTCSISMLYWYQNSTWSIMVTAKDNTTTVNDTSKTFVYNQLVASSLSTTTINFGTMTSAQYGTNVTAPGNITINNTGNKVLSLYVTGADLTDSGGKASDIDVGQFYVDTDSGVAGALKLTTSSQQISGASVPIEDTTPGGNTEELWWFFSVPNPFEPGTYSGTWTLTES